MYMNWAVCASLFFLGAMNKQYLNDPWEINMFQSKVNQKCWDAAQKLRQNGMGASKDESEENGNWTR